MAGVPPPRVESGDSSGTPIGAWRVQRGGADRHRVRPWSSLRGGSLAMQAANYPRNGDREEQRARETLGRYRSREYVRRYKAEYTNGLGPKHVRSRVVAAGEKAAIAQLLREIDPAGSALLDVPCGTGKLGPLLQTFPVHVVAADASREVQDDSRRVSTHHARAAARLLQLWLGLAADQARRSDPLRAREPPCVPRALERHGEGDRGRRLQAAAVEVRAAGPFERDHRSRGRLTSPLLTLVAIGVIRGDWRRPHRGDRPPLDGRVGGRREMLAKAHRRSLPCGTRRVRARPSWNVVQRAEVAEPAFKGSDFPDP